MTPERWAAVDPRLRVAWEDLRTVKQRRFRDGDLELTRLLQQVFFRCGPHRGTRGGQWFGLGGQQFVADFMSYSEALWETGCRALVETGTASGATTRFFDECLSRRYPNGDYRVVTIELSQASTAGMFATDLPHVVQLVGDSADPEVRDHVWSIVSGMAPCSVTLDSDHDARHVLAEMDLYAPLVTPGSHLIIQDTFLGLYWGGNLDLEAMTRAVASGDVGAFDYAGCPLGAVEAFLEVHGDDWEVDLEPTRMLVVQNPYGFLRRKSKGAP